MHQTKPYGLILTGGQSTRMGSDKSLLQYTGKPQREHLHTLLSTLCANVFTSCRKDQEVPAALNPLCDYYTFPGPINGILTAFRAHPEVCWLIVAVDMPFIDEPALQVLWQGRNQQKLATCFLHSPENFPEPLLTVWEPKAFPLLLDFAQDGNISPRAFLEQSDVQTLKAPNKQILLNINYPRDIGPLL
jgi:molybdopterin-guanine dinucleotide biosynthesis protein A